MNSEPSKEIADPKSLLLGQLSYYRTALLDKVRGLTLEQLTTSILPSGWTPLGLLNHLAYVERRWVEWGFQGRPVDDPWGDHDPVDDDRWVDPPVETDDAATLLEAWTSVADRLERQLDRVAAEAEMDTRSERGGRFPVDSPEAPPTLGWILLHLLQEYARHVGHLDVVRELLDGRTGE